MWIIIKLLRLIFSSGSTPKKNSKKPDPSLVKITDARSANEIADDFHSLPRVKVCHVVDGDTVIIIPKDSKKETIRLDSIDCPEDGQAWGDKATFGLIRMIGGGREVVLERHGTDPYGRTLATLYAWKDDKQEWINVNERMVMLGHAWVMRLYYKHLPNDRRNKLNQLENWAKRKKMGLWNTANPIPPWQWRKNDT